MSDLDRAIARQRAAALRGEREAQRALESAYRAILLRLQSESNALIAALAEAEAAGVEITPKILAQGRTAIPNVQALKGETYKEAAERVRQRYAALTAQTEAEMARYARYAEGVITTGQRAAVQAALPASEAVMAAALGTPPPGVSVAFNRLPVGAIEELVGALGDGSPLGDLLDGLGAEASKAGRAALIEGLGKGLSPRQLAREFRLGANVGAVRALRISRNEINRAYRSASLENYRANSDVVTGWRWLCAGGKRTCGLCYAMSGKVFPLSTPFASHPQCRCAITPVTREIPGYQSPPDPEDGPTVFARLTEKEQRTILGRGKFALFQAGDDWDWDDLVAQTRDARWGAGRRERALNELVARQAQAAD